LAKLEPEHTRYFKWPQIRYPITMDAILRSIIDDDRRRVKELLPFHLAVQDTGRGGTGAEAARAAQRAIIGEFLSFGLSPALKDSKGKSVFDCAKSSWIRNLLSENATGPTGLS
jgi:hypothetical protein